MNSPVRVEPTTRFASCVGHFTPPMLVTGDDIPALHILRSSLTADGVGEARVGEDARVVLIGVDLTNAGSRREVKRAFRRHVAECVLLCNRLARLSHLVFVTGGETDALESHVLAVGEEVSRSVHALLEQACGASVAVTVVVANSQDDASLLAVGIAQRTRRSPRINASASLTSRELLQDPLGLAGMNDFL